jgi:hypothetical protein
VVAAVRRADIRQFRRLAAHRDGGGRHCVHNEAAAADSARGGGHRVAHAACVRRRDGLHELDLDRAADVLEEPAPAADVYAANNPINFVDPSGLSFMQGLTDFSAGFGDKATFGLTRWVRKKLGVNDVVNPCSGLYTAGGITGIVVTAIATSGLGAEAEVAGNAGVRFTQTTARSHSRMGPCGPDNWRSGCRTSGRND